MYPLEHFGYRIKKLRQLHGLTQAALGLKCNVTQKTISHWETNYRTPSPDVIPRLAEALGTTTGELYGESARPPVDQALKRHSIWLIAERLELLDEYEHGQVLAYIEGLIAEKDAKRRD